MSQVKVVKNKKKQNKVSIMPYIRTLWKNEACVDAAYSAKFFVPLIIFIVAALLSIIPITVQTATAKGGAFLEGQTIYNMDEAFYSFLEDAEKNKYDIKFDQDTKTAELDGKPVDSSNNYLLYEHKNVVLDGHDKDFIDLQVYYIPKGIDYEAARTTIGALTPNSNEGRDASFIIFGYDKFCAYFYKPTSYNQTSSGAYGDYQKIDAKFTSLKSMYVANKENYRIINAKDTLANFKEFVDQTYINTKVNLTFAQAGILLAVNVGITLLMGLVVWLLTKGKNNPNKGLSILKAYAITFWTTLTPSILAVALGFLIPNFALMIYVALFGFRIMWLSSSATQGQGLLR